MAIAAKNQETAAAVDAKSDIADEAAEWLYGLHWWSVWAS
jgi:hypothetical protein